MDETINQAVLDCGASRTVCGTEWYTVYLDSLPERVREQVTEYPSDTMFRFGVGTMRASKRVLIPVTICKRDIRLEVDVVATDIPLLISLQTQWHKLLKWLGIQSGKKIRLLLYLLNAYKYLAALRPDHGLIMLNPQFHTILYRA